MCGEFPNVKKESNLWLRRKPRIIRTGRIRTADVKREFGHDVGKHMIYMVKTKSNMATDGRAKRVRNTKSNQQSSPLTTAAMWVDAIRQARQLLKSTGSVANATALLKALADK